MKALSGSFDARERLTGRAENLLWQPQLDQCVCVPVVQVRYVGDPTLPLPDVSSAPLEQPACQRQPTDAYAGHSVLARPRLALP